MISSKVCYSSWILGTLAVSAKHPSDVLLYSNNILQLRAANHRKIKELFDVKGCLILLPRDDVRQAETK